MRFCILFTVVFLTTSLSALKKNSRNSEAQQTQNLIINQWHLRRLKDDSQLRDAIAQHYLVSLATTPFLQVSPKMKPSRRYCLPGTLALVQSMANLYFLRFGEPLVVSSAVRTIKDQRRLRWSNRNAASTTGPEASSHPTGATVDIERRRMTKEQTEFMDRLLYLYAREERIVYIKEYGELCYHVFVVPEEEEQ